MILHGNFKGLTRYLPTLSTETLKPGESHLHLRILLVGGKFGPPVLTIMEVSGKEVAIGRIHWNLNTSIQSANELTKE